MFMYLPVDFKRSLTEFFFRPYTYGQKAGKKSSRTWGVSCIQIRSREGDGATEICTQVFQSHKVASRIVNVLKIDITASQSIFFGSFKVAQKFFRSRKVAALPFRSVKFANRPFWIGMFETYHPFDTDLGPGSNSIFLSEFLLEWYKTVLKAN